MAESPTDFIDFNAWKSATAATEEDALRRQQSEVESRTTEADRLLKLTANDAAAEQGNQRRGGGPATAGLSNVGSYSTYLKAKQSAANARAAMMLGKSGEYGDVRGQVDAERGYSTGAESTLDALQYRENTRGGRLEEGRVQGNLDAESLRARRAKEEAAAKAEAARQDAHSQKFNADILRRMREKWASQDSAHGQAGGAGAFNPFKTKSQGFGGYANPFGWQRGLNADGVLEGNRDQQAMMGEAFWDLEDNQRLAQMARSQGMFDDAAKFQSSGFYDFSGKRTSGGY